jgi:hypothetical protein
VSNLFAGLLLALHQNFSGISGQVIPMKNIPIPKHTHLLAFCPAQQAACL